MGNVEVDQIGLAGELVRDVDTTLSPRERQALLMAALPGARLDESLGVKVVRFQDQVILSKQITHLGRPWKQYKKRIQIPKAWLPVHADSCRRGLTPRFVGVYHHDRTTIFVDFETTNYAAREVNNSSAHLATNDLFQAQTLGQFSRLDKNDNRITSIRFDAFEAYLRFGYEERNDHLSAIDRFTTHLLDGTRIDGLTAVQEMHASGWPDSFQNEWQGFYLEFRLSEFLSQQGMQSQLAVQKEKGRSSFDYDLRFIEGGRTAHYGDLKASDITAKESPGNDAARFHRCLHEYGKFWYVIYEHHTWHSRDNGDVATVAWNEWRRSVGHVGRNSTFNPLSYAGKFKEAVLFQRVKVLEVNQSNVGVVLKEFQKGFKQPDGSLRKAKVSIQKQDIENFLIYSKSL